MLEQTLPVTPHSDLSKVHRDRIDRVLHIGFAVRLSRVDDWSHQMIPLMPIQHLINRALDMGVMTIEDAKAWMKSFQNDLANALNVDPLSPVPDPEDMALTGDLVVFSMLGATTRLLTDRLMGDAKKLCATEEQAIELALNAARSAALHNLTELASLSERQRWHLWSLAHSSDDQYH